MRSKILLFFFSLSLASLAGAGSLRAERDDLAVDLFAVFNDGTVLEGTFPVTICVAETADQTDDCIVRTSEEGVFRSGVFQASLDLLETISATDLADRLFLTIAIDGPSGTEQFPSIELTGVPWAVRARLADQALTLVNPITASQIDDGTITSQELEQIPGVAGNYTNPTITVDTAGRVIAISSGAAGAGDITSVLAGSGLTGGGLTGDVTLSLAATGVAAGTYGSATEVPQIAVGADGRITGAANVAITGLPPSGAAGGDLTGTYPSPTIAGNAVTSAKIADGTITGADLVSPFSFAGTLTVDALNVNATNITLDADNAGAGADQTISFNRGTDNANDAQVAWNETSDIFSFFTDGGTTLANVRGADPVAAGDFATKNYVDSTAGGTGDITAVTAGTGLTGGGTSGSVTLSLDTGGVTSTQILDGTITAADIGTDAVGSDEIAANAVGASEIAITAVTAGTYGSATEVGQFTVDADGRLTAAAAVAISVPPSGAAGGDLAGTYPNPTIAANALALGTDTTGNYVATVTGNTQLSVSGSGSESAAVTLSLGADSIDFAELEDTLNPDSLFTTIALDATQGFIFDAETTDTTNASGAVQFLVDSGTDNAEAVTIDIQAMLTNAAGTEEVTGLTVIPRQGSTGVGGTHELYGIQLEAPTDVGTPTGTNVEYGIRVRTGYNYAGWFDSPVVATDDLNLGSPGGSDTANLVFYDNDGGSPEKITFAPPAGVDLTADISYTLPSAVASSNGQVLSSTTGGVLSWATVDTSTTNEAPIGSSYVVISTDGTLTQERALSAGTGLTLTDGGAGGFAIVNVGAGSGITTNADSIELGNLTNNWSQSGAFDIVLNNANSELLIMESAGNTFVGTLDAGDLSQARTWTLPNADGTVVTTGFQNAGTDVTADLEEETHGSEHDGTDGDYVTDSGDTMTGDLTFNKTSPAAIFDTSAAGDTDFWIGIVENFGGTGTDDDWFVIGDGTSPGTNTYFFVDTRGQVGIGSASLQDRLTVAGGVRVGRAPNTLTTLNGALAAGATPTITVVSTTNYPSTGTLLIGNEAMTYTGTTATTFTGVTRSILGTTLAAHDDGSTVDILTLASLAQSDQARTAITGSGSVGINTITPDDIFDIEKDGGIAYFQPPAVTADNDTNDSVTLRLRAKYDSNSGVGLTPATIDADLVHTATIQGSSHLAVKVGGTERMSVYSSGNVGIGTSTTPSNTLEVNGNIASSSGSRIGAGTTSPSNTLDVNGTVRLGFSGFTIVDNNATALRSAGTLNPTTSFVIIDCLDTTDGCDVTMGETGPPTIGQIVTIVNETTPTVNFADTSGVSELAGAFAAGQWDSISMIYLGSRWVETNRSNN